MFDTMMRTNTERQALPAGLAAMPPGPELGRVLAEVDVFRLSGRDRVVVLQAEQRMVAHYHARSYRTIAAVTETVAEELEDDTLPHVAAATSVEIAAALRLTRRAADREVETALDLQRRLPTLWDALVTGRVDLRRLWVLLGGTVHLSDPVARRVIDEVIEEAPRLTTGQLGARLRKACFDVDPDDAARRYRHAVAERRVVTEPTTDGAANLMALDLPADQAAAAARRINHLARQLRRRGETRSMDQLRADVFLDLLTGTGPAGSGPKGSVDLQVGLATLVGLSDEAGELCGFGPVVADVARQVVEQQLNARWRFTITHPDTGQPLHTGITRRRPTAQQHREVTARYRTCVFPGCRMPSIDCDLDHRVRHTDNGATCECNLAPMCRYHHTVRHRAGWTYRRVPNGDHVFTTLLGHRHTTSGRPP
jgi:hypothetical protein